MTVIVRRRLAGHEGECPARLEAADLHLVQMLDSLAPGRGLELRLRDELALEAVLLNAPVLDQDRRIAFEDPIERRVSVQKLHDGVIEDEQDRGPEQPSERPDGR